MTINQDDKAKLIPALMTLGVIVADQASKIAITLAFPRETFLGTRVIGDFFSLVHVRNTGVAFSMGAGLDGLFRVLLLVILPLAILSAIGVYYWRAKDLSRLQRWCVAAIVGGGLGNLIDRVFRPEGVVDFLKFKIYGLFGMDYFPTFNLADSSVVLGGIVLVLSFVFAKDAAGKAAGKKD
jgi:signal peptidase II